MCVCLTPLLPVYACVCVTKFKKASKLWVNRFSAKITATINPQTHSQTHTQAHTPSDTRTHTHADVALALRFIPLSTHYHRLVSISLPISKSVLSANLCLVFILLMLFWQSYTHTHTYSYTRNPTPTSHHVHKFICDFVIPSLVINFATVSVSQGFFPSPPHLFTSFIHSFSILTPQNR